MNYSLIRESFRSFDLYGSISDSLHDKYGVNYYLPVSIEEQSDDAYSLFILTLADDIAKGKFGDKKRLLLIFPDEKSAIASSVLLSQSGIPSFFYPARDFNFYNITASHDLEHERLSVLSHLLFTDEAAVITATIEGVMQRTVPAEILASHSFSLEIGKDISLEKTVMKLVSAGYKRASIVEGVGQFSVRGGILDIFPPGPYPVRCELFGDEIDRLCHFDVITQRAVTQLDKALIAPALEMIVSPDAKHRIEKTVSNLIERNKSRKSVPGDIEDKLKKELVGLACADCIDFSDKYPDDIFEKFECLADYFDGVISVRNISLCLSRLEACEKLLSENTESLAEIGEMPFSPAESWLAGKKKLSDKIKSSPTVVSHAFISAKKQIRSKDVFKFSDKSVLGGNSSDVPQLLKELTPFYENNYKCIVTVGTEAEENALFDLLLDEGFSPVKADIANEKKAPDVGDIGGVFSKGKSKKQPVALICGNLSASFEIPSEKFVIFSLSAGGSKREATESGRIRKRRNKNSKEIITYHDLTPGDYVVHDVYGIGLYEGIENLTVDGVSRDYVNIKYAGSDKLFLPVDQLDLVAKYIGAADSDGEVKLSKMGGTEWKKSKAKAKSAAKDIAKELIALYAKRRNSAGIAFDVDDVFSRQFADAFPYEETESQEATIADVAADMEKPYPMDRMICGDVGYGKTEVAVRAAFKAVSSGYQVALLVPTTILAFQHYQTFLARFRGFPVSIDFISRFGTAAKRERSLRMLRRGETDIIIGTHRLISKDVAFKKLGLIVIDEEQRFGVKQKEKLKQISVNADVLTLTATPIPRTLNMAIGGLMDMSILDDVPGLRSPVQTYVTEYDEEMLFEAARREMKRGGQVFWLHNRVDTIYAVANRIQKAIPEAKVAVGHGQLGRDEIEAIWDELVRGEIDILVSTTIIESGIDVPNANTLIVDRADKFGLSQLHQIRGRVGRSSKKAYAYFTFPPVKSLSDVAEKRLRAIKEYTSFGAGFKIAMRDMEIRGVGNLLGSEQHGHMDSVGYDMYLKLLNEAVLEENGDEVKEKLECTVLIKTDAYIPESYISDAGQRMEMYKKIARIECTEDFDDVVDEFCDRFGDIPSPVLSLCRTAYLRCVAVKCRVTRIEQTAGEIKIFPSDINPFILNDLARSVGHGAVRFSKAPSYAVCFKIPKGKNSIDFSTEIVEKYLELIEDDERAAREALPPED